MCWPCCSYCPPLLKPPSSPVAATALTTWVCRSSQWSSAPSLTRFVPLFGCKYQQQGQSVTTGKIFRVDEFPECAIHSRVSLPLAGSKHQQQGQMNDDRQDL